MNTLIYIGYLVMWFLSGLVTRKVADVVDDYIDSQVVQAIVIFVALCFCLAVFNLGYFCIISLILKVAA